jgi:cell wall-associated NlpC family hydrolase
MSVVPQDLLNFLNAQAVQGPPPEERPSRPTFDSLTRIRWSLALSSPDDGRLRHLPFSALSYEQQDAEVATRVTASIPDVISNLGPLWEICTMGTPVWLLGGTDTLEEIFRGTIAEVGERSSTGSDFPIVAYDGLHDALRSKYDLVMASSHVRFSDVMRRYAALSGIELGHVEEPGVDLGSVVIRQKTMLDGLNDMLKQVVVLGGGLLKLRTWKNKLEAVRPGSNDTVYVIRSGGAAVQTTIHGSKAEMIDKVIVLGHGADENKLPVVKTLTADAGFTGAQEIVYSGESDSEEVTRLTAEQILAQKGFPTWTYTATFHAFPGIYKWDRHRFVDGITDNHFFIAGLSMDLVAHTAKATLVTTEDIARATRQIKIDTALAKLKGIDTPGSVTGKTAADQIKSKASKVMGLAYNWGGAGGRSDFSEDMHHVGTDCSGFVSWLTHQFGCDAGGTTADAIAAANELVATSSLDKAEVGDYIAYWDGGATQAGANYPHIAIFMGGQNVIESGGSVKPSGIGMGHVLTGYSRYEVRRNTCLYSKLRTGGTR